MARGTEDAAGAGEGEPGILLRLLACWAGFRLGRGHDTMPAMEYESRIAVDARPGLLRGALPYWRQAAQLGLAGALMAGLLWRVDLAAVRAEVESATLWWLPLAFVANLASDWFRAIRWQRFFAPLTRLDVRFLFAVAVLGVAVNLALPMRAGEFVRGPGPSRTGSGMRCIRLAKVCRRSDGRERCSTSSGLHRRRGCARR